MAKRKRLTPAQADYLAPRPDAGTAPAGAAGGEAARASLGAAPIAQVAGEASARAALNELAAEVESARAEGRLLEAVPLEAIDENHLVRDRMEQDEDELQALMNSLSARGQQMPIEVVRLPALDTETGSETGESAARYGLISGWRRLTALRRLQAQTGDPRFATVRAMVIAPQDARAAYQAMVEENEIRVDLSLYERARIAVRAMHEHVYPTQRAALQGLFGSTTRSKRSKIGSFIALVEAFDKVLRFPTAIPERLGLALAREVLRDEGFRARLIARLNQAAPQSAAAELAVLQAAVAEAERAGAERMAARAAAVEKETKTPGSESHSPAAPTATAKRETRPQPAPAPIWETARPGAGIELRFAADLHRIEICGDAVDATLWARLQDWLSARD